MGVIVVVLAIIAFLVLFAYVTLPPPYANKRLVSTFNSMTLGLCAFICFVIFLNIKVHLKDTQADKYWLPMAILGTLGAEVIFLTVLFLIRNFWVFRPPRRRF